MFTKIKELQLNFEVYGSGSPLLILHGWQDSAATWYTVAQELAINRQVYLLNLPGFGHSENPPNSWGLSDYTELVLAFINEFNLTSDLILVGHSFGGEIAANLVANYKSPVAKLILVSSSGLKYKSLVTHIKLLLMGLYKPFSLLFPIKIKSKLKDKVSSEDYRQAGELKRVFLSIVNTDIECSLSKIKIPVLIVWGDRDDQLNISLAKRFEKLIPNSYIRVVWEAGHFPHIECPNALVEILNEF